MSIKIPVVCLYWYVIMSLYVLLSKVLYLAFFKIAFFILVNESLQYLAEVLNIFLLYYFNIFTGLVFLTVSIFSLPTSVWGSNICTWQLVAPVGYFCYSFSAGYKIVLWSHREELRVGHQWNRKSSNGNV